MVVITPPNLAGSASYSEPTNDNKNKSTQFPPSVSLFCTTLPKSPQENPFARKKKMGLVEEAHNVKIVGSGNQTIVLAHGFGTDQSVWKHLVPHLLDDYRVILFDNIGAGTTNPDYFDFERYSTLEGYAYDVIAILEELRVQSCIFVGHSVSAMIGAIASITRPDLFTKLVAISASPRLDH